MNTDTVFILLNTHGRICSVNANQADAEAKRDKFNADPFLASEESDPDAPYTVESWTVTK